MSYTARKYMSRKVLTFSPDMEVLEAVSLLVQHDVSGGPVVDRFGNLVGVLSEIDCLRGAVHAGYHGSHGGKVSEYMRVQFKTVDVDDSIMDIVRLFREDEFYYYRGFPVMLDNRVVGRIGLRDVLRALQDMAQEEAGA